MYFKLQFFVISYTILIVSVSGYTESDIVSAKIETCRGCSLNRLPEVKQFVMQDAPLYDRVAVNFITGAPPELVLLGEADQELERLPLSHLNRRECNDLLEKKGFSKQTNKEEF